MAPGGSSLGEFELIRRYFIRGGKGLPPPRAAESGDGAHSGVVLGIGDDAALLRVPAGSELAVTVDSLVEGRHFPPGSDARSIGHRAMAVNLSDLAAMGATPAWATLALTMPAADAAWLERFAAGLFALADAHRVVLVGGDTTGGPLTVSVQLLGLVPQGSALRRGGGRAGDWLVVTGTLGDAAAGLRLRQAGIGSLDAASAAELIERFEFPTPRVRFGCAARTIASAAMDISDGLAGDLPKLAAASGLGALIEVDRLPLSRALRAVAAENQARDWALAGGEDYELLLAVDPLRYEELAAAAAACDLALTVVGALETGSGVTWSANGREFSPVVQGYDHFR